MTYHHKLTESARAELRARGFRPAQIWIRPRDEAFWEETLAEAREIARAEDEADLDLFIEVSARETFRLINEMEREGVEK